MRIKKTIMLYIVFLVGVGSIFLCATLDNQIFTQLEEVKNKSNYVYIINNNMLYNNFCKRFDGALLQELIESFEFDGVEEIPNKTFGNKDKGGGWNTWFRFYDDNALMFTITQYAGGRLCVNGEWYAYLSKESEQKLDSLLVSVGLTDDLALLPQAANVTAVTNVIFRKESTIPYVMNDAIFIIPDEQFSVGMTERGENTDYPGYYRIHYQEDQNYENSLGIHFHDEKYASAKQQARLDVTNNSAARIGFELYSVTSEEVNYDAGCYEVGRGEILSIEVDPAMACYVLTAIRRLWDADVAASELMEDAERWGSGPNIQH